MSQVERVSTCALKARRTYWVVKKERVFHYFQKQDGQACILSRLFAYSQRYQSVSQSINRVVSIRLSVHPCCPFHLYHIHCSLYHSIWLSSIHKSIDPSIHSSHILMMQETRPTILISSQVFSIHSLTFICTSLGRIAERESINANDWLPAVAAEENTNRLTPQGETRKRRKICSLRNSRKTM